MLKNKIMAVVLCVSLVTGLSIVARDQVYAADATLKVTVAQKTTVKNEGFKDMTNSHWAYDSTLWAQAEGMISGYPGGTFKPNKEVSEAEFLAMLVRVMDVAGEVKPNAGKDWSDPYYTKAKAVNYPVTGKRTESITRTKVAELVSSTRGVNYSGQQAIQYILGNKLSIGKTAASIEGYKGNDKLTRAEAVQFLRNVIDRVDVIGLMERPAQPSNPAELPKLPEVKPVENTNAKLEALRKQVEKVMSKDGYTVWKSPHEFSIGIDGTSGETIATYADYRGTDGVRTVNLYKPYKPKDTVIDMSLINATITMIQAAGVSVDAKLADDIVEVLTTPVKEKTIENNGFKIWMIRVGSELLLTIN